MKLTLKQIKMFRKPFDDMGAFEGRTEEEINKLLCEVADIYITLAKINLNSKQKNN